MKPGASQHVLQREATAVVSFIFIDTKAATPKLSVLRQWPDKYFKGLYSVVAFK